MRRDSRVHAPPIRDLMQQEEIGALVRKASQLAALNEALAGVLPPELARECVVANLRQGSAILLASSGAVAAKLRMLAPRMRVRLAEAGGPVEEVRVEVQVRPRGPDAPRPQPRVPSEAAARHLRALAEKLGDSQLRSSILAIARKAGR